jgi:sirohydrochlorin ferrochelatase
MFCNCIKKRLSDKIEILSFKQQCVVLSDTEDVFTRRMVLLPYVLCSGIVTYVCVPAGVNNLLINWATCVAESLGFHAFINIATGVFLMNV